MPPPYTAMELVRVNIPQKATVKKESPSSQPGPFLRTSESYFLEREKCEDRGSGDDLRVGRSE